MSKNKHSIAALVAAIALAAGHVAAAAEEAQPKRVAVYYFGNSLTGTTIPELHPALGKSAGKEWKWDIMAVAGGQLWQYRDQFELDAKIGPVGEFTLDPELAKKGPWAVQQFFKGEWDAITLQPFSINLKFIANEMWGKKYDHERDFGDLAASKYLIDLALKKNPKCRVFVYQDYPSYMPNYMGAMEQVGHQTGKELNHRMMEPLRRSYDYPRQWFRKYNETEPCYHCGECTRSYEWLLMDKLIEAYPELWKSGQLRIIPVGDVYYALDRRMRAGQIPGVENIGQYYTDGLHNRAGLPAYTASATFYTMLFGDRPHHLDHTIYNDPDSFGKDWGHGKDMHNDTGVLLPITPEAAKVVNDTIWEVVNAHPYTRFSGKGSKEALAKCESAIPAPEPLRVLEFGRIASWSAMPFWQAALDRTAGKHSVWGAMMAMRSWEQSYGAEWLDGAIKADKLPYLYIYCAAGYGLHEKNHDSVFNQALCVSIAAPTDKEVAGFVNVAKFFLPKRPAGFMLANLSWPAIPEAAKLKTELKLEPWQLIPEEKMAAIRKAFDYTAAWAAAQEREGTAAGMNAFIGKLKNADPEIARRTRLIPAGALLAALDLKLKAGALPGVSGVGEFYKDDVTLRTGLPRYALAALRFAVVHQANPKDLDAAFFNEPKTYHPDAFNPANKRGNGKEYVVVRDEEFDNGPHFAITPAGKKLVDDVVWELVGNKQQ